MKTKITIFFIFLFLAYILHGVLRKKLYSTKKIENKAIYDSKIPAMKMYYCIEKYSKEYDVPKDYLKAIAFQETKYCGPTDYNYDPNHTSSANALGPMQVKLSTAKLLDKNITQDKLLLDIDSNIRISAQLLKYLYNRYGDWQLAFGAYNTGHPCKNNYSKLIENKSFNWLTPSGNVFNKNK